MGFLVPVVSVAAAGAVLWGGAEVVQAVARSQESVQVVRVIDGDTIEVRRDGEVVDVRLLNVDTPETKDPGKPVECLGPQATQFLTRMLPAGTSVRLEHDAVREDRYGRELAGVFADGVLVNAEIARAGYGAAEVVGGNDRFYSEVLAAQDEARAAGVGIHSPDVECTVSAQVRDLEEKVQEAAGKAGPGQDMAAIEARQQELDSLRAEAAVILLLFGDDDSFAMRALAPADAAELGNRFRATQRQVSAMVEANDQARTAEADRLRLAAEEAARLEAQRQARQSTSSSMSSGSSSGGGTGTPTRSDPAPAPAPDKYTGCRAYGSGGTSIDDKGRPYTKIDCVTKLPIG